MNRNYRDLAVVVALTVAAVIAILIDHPSLRFVFGAPLALWLPGRALTAAIFDRGDDLEGVLRLLLTLGLSIAAAVLGGFVLNLTPWGLRPIPWALWLGGVTILAAAVAGVRRRGEPISPPAGMSFDLSLSQVVLLAAALAVMGGAFGMARWGAMQAPTAPFTQLWVTPVTRADGDAVGIAIVNREDRAERYRLEVSAGDEVIYGWSALMVGRGQRWQQTVPVPDDAAVEVRIFRADAPQDLYRRVVLPRKVEE